ncbi:MAG: hypothetical protein IID32_04885 [Planctomycetes bacterium]|nr:hypothetical protein [Planctomycetota bacterium]
MKLKEAVISAFTKVSRVSQGSQGRVIVWGVLGWLCLLNAGAWGQFSGGSGTSTNPYLISTAADLQAIGLNSVHWDKHFKLTADLDLTGVAMTPIGSAAIPFTGTFDGAGHLISNFSYTSTGTDNIGLFGVLDTGAEIRDVNLVNANVDGGTGNNIGALVGWKINGTIRNSGASGAVSGDTNVGGLVGRSDSGTISGCTADSRVNGTGRHVGGLVGILLSSGVIEHSYAMGIIAGDFRVGGLLGHNIGTILTSYSIGGVSGNTDVGGLVGFDNGGTVLASFWDTESSGQATSAGGTGKTTAEMQTAGMFLGAGWDFVGEAANGTEEIWAICGGSDYPRFVWEIVAMEDFVCPDHMRVWFTPRRFNPMSQGKWIKGHVIMPEGIEPADIDSAVMVRLAPFGILSDEVEVIMNESGQVELVITFDRAEVLAALETEAENHSLGITLIGAFADGSTFYASSTITILESRVGQLNLIASHWLSGDCHAWDWCEGTDDNQDGVVNYADFFLETLDFIYIFAND